MRSTVKWLSGEMSESSIPYKIEVVNKKYNYFKMNCKFHHGPSMSFEDIGIDNYIIFSDGENNLIQTKDDALNTILKYWTAKKDDVKEKDYAEYDISEATFSYSITSNGDVHQLCGLTGKLCYSQKEAGTIVNHNTKGHQKKYFHKVPVRAYFCEDCRQYHLTSETMKTYIYGHQLWY